MRKITFIKAPLIATLNGCETAPDQIKKIYDYEMNKSYCDKKSVEELDKIIEGANIASDVIVTIGGDHSVSIATILSQNKIHDNLKILYFDSHPDILLDTNHNSSFDENKINMAVSSHLTGYISTNNKILEYYDKPIHPEQIIYVGLHESLTYEQLSHHDSFFLTVDKINQLDSQTPNIIKDSIENNKIHVTLDLKVFKSLHVPTNKGNIGLSLESVINILKNISEKIISIDIVEFNPTLGTPHDATTTRETIRKCLTEVFNIKEKKINIFNETTKFLVYRPVKQESAKDVGWYLLMGLSNSERDKLMELIDNDTIIKLKIDDEDYMITKTCMEEQHTKSFFTNPIITDVVLFPEEKGTMCFELLNTV